MKIVWTEDAKADLKDIETYYDVAGSASFAARVFQGIITSTNVIMKNPFIGRVSENFKDVHEWAILPFNYLLIYRLKVDKIEILRVFDTRQDPTKKF